MRLEVSNERYADLKEKLIFLGIEIDNNADLILSEKNKYLDHLIVKKKINNEKVRLSVKDIIYIESFGHDVNVHTEEQCYHTTDRLYQILIKLNSIDFLRVSNSVIISKNSIKSIRPTLTQKFVLTLTTGSTVDVTRTYYYAFKEAMGI